MLQSLSAPTMKSHCVADRTQLSDSLYQQLLSCVCRSVWILIGSVGNCNSSNDID